MKNINFEKDYYFFDNGPFLCYNLHMGRKTKKQQAIDLLQELNENELKEVLNAFDNSLTDNLYQNLERSIRKECPYCHSENIIQKGKNNIGLTQFKCKNCNKKFNILSKTPLEKTPYSWNVWVSVLEYMLKRQSIKTIRHNLINNKIVSNISEETVSAIENKLRNSFIELPLPKLKGVIQCDEKHFRESQKGTKNPINVLDSGNRKGHKRATPSKYGTMGPEFSTICCAVDGSGHSIAKVVRMGYMSLEDFEDDMAIHFENITFLCSDMNTVYTQYASIHKIPQYVCNSGYHKIMAKCNTQAKKVAAYEQDKLDYIVGAGIMSYNKMVSFRNINKLTINGVNAYHSELERYINHIAKGVSTKHLQAWVSFFNYCNNYRVDNGHYPSTYEDAEKILIEIIKLRNPIKVDDIKTQKDLTKRQPKRYTKKFIKKTVAARIKSNNPYIKFTEEDGIWIVNKKKSIDLLPEYKRRQLAKALRIKPFSPIAVSSADLKKKLLSHPDLEDALYVLANGDINT